METKHAFRVALAMALLAVVIGCQDPLGYTGDDTVDCPGCLPPPGGDKFCKNNGADLAPLLLASGGHGSDFVEWTFAMTNVGSATALISNQAPVGYQIYYSVDGVSKDQPACGSSFGQPLAPGDAAARTLHCNFDKSISEFRFAIVELHQTSHVECNTSNNRLVVPLPF